MPPSAKVVVRTMVVTFVDGSQELIVEVDVDCPRCGGGDIGIVGHHIADLSARLQEIQAKYPDLCGKVGTVTSEIQWGGTVDPRKMEMN